MAENVQNRKHSTWELFKRFVPYFSKYKTTLYLDLFFASLTTLCELALPLILRKIATVGMEDAALLTKELIWQMAGIYFVLRIIDVLGNYYMSSVGHIMGAKIETDMRRDAFSHLQNLSDSFYNNTKVGQIMARITSDLFDVTEFAHHCPEEFFIGALKLVISFAVLAKIDLVLTMAIFIFIPIMLVSVTKFNRLMRSAFKSQRNHIGDLNAGIEDALLGMRVVRSFANEEIEKEKFERDNQKFLGIKKQAYKYLAGFHSMTRIFDGIMYLMVILLGGFFILNGRINAADLLAYIMYVTTLLATVRRIVEFMEQFQRGMTGIERFIEIMDTDVDIKDEPDAVELKHVDGKITFDNVSFEYPDDHNKVLSNLSFVVEPGENIALVGPSGGGKTTLCNLIPRFYDVTEGNISIDDSNIKNFTLNSLRSKIGMVQQDVYLFSGSVFENIEYGRPGASKAEVEYAAKLAGAYDFIMNLHDGFDTYVGERGVKLSGGQKQRISIARVFLKNPPILILDEATSALDNQSERIIQQSLVELSKGRTTLTIAHRLSTIRGAHKILVLTEEGIKEQGSHSELMALKGMYYDLYTQGNQEEDTLPEDIDAKKKPK